MSKRAITAKQRAWLLDELSLWRRDAVVSEQQAQRIADLYEGAGEMAERGRSRAVFVLMAAAATLVGLAALLLIGYNWNDLSREIKLALVLGVIAVTHAAGFSLRYKKNAGTLSENVFFLGCLFYGAGIWLVAQVFHINSHYPDGVWWWAIGVLPFALCLETRLLHALLVTLLGLWAGMEVLNFDHLGAWFFGRWGFLPNGAYSLPLLALPGIVWAYRKESVKTLALYVPLLAWWTVLQVFAWKMGSNPFYFVGSVGALLLVAAECHPAGSRFAIPYRYYGSLLVGGVLVPLSFYDLNKHLVGEWASGFGPSALLAAVAFGAVIVARRTITRRQAIPLGLSLLMALLPLLTVGCRSAGCADAAALLPTILVNVAMVAGAFWLMQVGLQEDRGRPFGAGVLYFLLWSVLRYVDLFGDFGGMLGAASMFFVCGGALFGVARYWQSRKEVRYA
jgi:heme/copper-type cytochrome/quinol oxidase subunit 4